MSPLKQTALAHVLIFVFAFGGAKLVLASRPENIGPAYGGFAAGVCLGLVIAWYLWAAHKNDAVGRFRR